MSIIIMTAMIHRLYKRQGLSKFFKLFINTLSNVETKLISNRFYN